MGSAAAREVFLYGVLHVPGILVEEIGGHVVVFDARHFLQKGQALGALLGGAH